MSKKIGIVGAGVVGLSVAVRAIQEFGEGNVDITIVSEVFYNQTLSFGAGGLWEPYQIQGTPNEKVNEWGKYALDHFLALLNSPYGAQTGIQLLSSYQLFEAGQDASSPFWKDVVLNFRRMGTSDIQSMGLPSKFVSGYTFGTVTVEGKYYLRFLMDNLKRRGVKFVQKKIFSFDELSSFNFDVIVNCTGIGALNLCGDSAVYPVRGQVLRLRAPWLNNIWFFGSSYIIPNVDSVVIGGTTQRGDFNTNVDANDTERIINDIAAVFPAIRDAPIENIWVGLRPCRGPVRLETERKNGATIVHCYGHGGSGITLAMGCANEVVEKHLKPHLFGGMNRNRNKNVMNSSSLDSAKDIYGWIKEKPRL